MIVIGLTGATGSGKGLFSEIAKKYDGVVHIDTDKIARDVVKKGMPCLDELCSSFGNQILESDGSLNRNALSEIVFSDKNKLSVLNKITHKYITKEVHILLEKAKSEQKKACIIDAPLLFESSENTLCDVTVGIVAHEDIRKQRIIKRDKLSDNQAQKRIAAGKPSDFFEKNCDYIIRNDDDRQTFEMNCRRLIEDILNN